VRIHGIHGDRVNGYCVRVTPKYVYFICSENIFDKHPDIQRVRSDSRLVHVRPYIGNVVEAVQHWRAEHHLDRETFPTGVLSGCEKSQDLSAKVFRNRDGHFLCVY
jgi:hypothetical protein